MEIKSEPTDADEGVESARSLSPPTTPSRPLSSPKDNSPLPNMMDRLPADADDITPSRCPSSRAVDMNSPNVNHPGDVVEQTTDAGSNDAESLQPPPQQEQIKTEVVSPSASPPSLEDVRLDEETSSSHPSPKIPELVDARMPCRDVAPSTAACRRSAVAVPVAESSISKLESFVASLNQQHSRRCGPAGDAVPWSGSASALQLAAAAPAMSNGMRRPPVLPTSSTLLTSVVGRAPASTSLISGPSAAAFSAAPGVGVGVGVVLPSPYHAPPSTSGRRDEPLDLSVKKSINDSSKSNAGIGTSSTNPAEFHEPNGRTTGLYLNGTDAPAASSQERRHQQLYGGRKSETAVPVSVSSLACLERDFGEHSALLNRIGSLNQMRHVNNGLGDFPMQPYARLSYQQQQQQPQRHEPHLQNRAVHGHQQLSVALRPQNRHQQYELQGRSSARGSPYAMPPSGLPSGHVVEQRVSPVSAAPTYDRRSMIGQLLSVDVGGDGANDRVTRSDGRPPAVGGIRRAGSNVLEDDRSQRKHRRLHQQQHKQRVPSSALLPPPCEQISSAAAVKCLECNAQFLSLPELTIHMIHAGHYANIVRSDTDSRANTIRPGYNGWRAGGPTGSDIGKRLPPTAAMCWRRDLADAGESRLVSPTKSLDDESVSSTGLTDTASGSGSMSPVKSPVSSSSPMQPEEQDTGKLVSRLLQRLDPLVVRNLFGYSDFLGQPLQPLAQCAFDDDAIGCIDRKTSKDDASAFTAAAVFDMALKSMKKYIERSLDGAAINTKCQLMMPTQSHHQQQEQRLGEMMAPSGRSHLVGDAADEIRRKNSSSSSSSASSSSVSMGVVDGPQALHSTRGRHASPSTVKRPASDRLLYAAIPEKRRSVQGAREGITDIADAGARPLDSGELIRDEFDLPAAAADGDVRRHTAVVTSTPAATATTASVQLLRTSRPTTPIIAENGAATRPTTRQCPNSSEANDAEHRRHERHHNQLTAAGARTERRDLVCSSLDRPTSSAAPTATTSASAESNRSPLATSRRQDGNSRHHDGNTVTHSSLHHFGDDGATSAQSAPRQTASAADCSGPSEDNEYTTRFGKYCRLARELAGRAN